MFLNGGGMRGGPVHDHIEGAPLLAELRTAPKYRFYAVRDEFPALVATAAGGAAIVGELYDVPLDMLHHSLLPAEPPELELGTIELENGSVSFAMLLRRDVLEHGAGLLEITKYGGWRAYLDEGRAERSI
jgi:gamma-glutamylcyclotransferase (GGCT)/AIG2-like uncharacterized protein YtfP